MKNLIVLTVLSLLGFKLMAQQDIKGVYDIGEENTKVEIYDKEGSIWGKIVSSDNEKVKIGTDILRRFTYKDNKWVGTMYAIRKKKEMDAELVNEDEILNVIIHVGFITKNLYWKKQE